MTSISDLLDDKSRMIKMMNYNNLDSGKPVLNALLKIYE